MAFKNTSAIVDKSTRNFAPPVSEPLRPQLFKSRTEASVALSTTSTVVPETTYDIEHMPVHNDPREWSSLRKVNFYHLRTY